MRYGMVIDLKKCVGCMAATVACKAENQTRPGIFWNIVKARNSANIRRSPGFLCDHLHALQGSSLRQSMPDRGQPQKANGIVKIDDDKCIGCKYCIEACPYGARYFSRRHRRLFRAELTAMEKIGYAKHKQGVWKNALSVPLCWNRAKTGVCAHLHRQSAVFRRSGRPRQRNIPFDQGQARHAAFKRARHGTFVYYCLLNAACANAPWISLIFGRSRSAADRSSACRDRRQRPTLNRIAR